MMKINRKGTTRIVLEFKNVVVKIPNFTNYLHFLKGLIGNIQENNTWKWNSGRYEKGTSYLLCPVLWCSWGGWILIMKKASKFTHENYVNSSPNDFIEHKKYFEGDDTVSNYGWYKGKLVKIDYAQ